MQLENANLNDLHEQYEKTLTLALIGLPEHLKIFMLKRLLQELEISITNKIQEHDNRSN